MRNVSPLPAAWAERLAEDHIVDPSGRQARLGTLPGHVAVMRCLRAYALEIQQSRGPVEAAVASASSAGAAQALQAPAACIVNAQFMFVEQMEWTAWYWEQHRFRLEQMPDDVRAYLRKYPTAAALRRAAADYHAILRRDHPWYFRELDRARPQTMGALPLLAIKAFVVVGATVVAGAVAIGVYRVILMSGAQLSSWLANTGRESLRDQVSIIEESARQQHEACQALVGDDRRECHRSVERDAIRSLERAADSASLSSPFGSWRGTATRWLAAAAGVAALAYAAQSQQED